MCAPEGVPARLLARVSTPPLGRRGTCPVAKRRMGSSSSSPSPSPPPPPPPSSARSLIHRKRSGREFISATMAARKLLYHTGRPSLSHSLRPSVRQICYIMLSLPFLCPLPFFPSCAVYWDREISRRRRPPLSVRPSVLRRPLLALAAGPGQYFRRRRHRRTRQIKYECGRGVGGQVGTHLDCCGSEDGDDGNIAGRFLEPVWRRYPQ